MKQSNQSVSDANAFLVDHTGCWMGAPITRVVFENLEYPWFAPTMQVFESGTTAVQDVVRMSPSVLMPRKKA